MNHYAPPKSKAPQSYSSVVLALEFASNNQEVLDVLNPLSPPEIKGIDKLNYVDFGFLAAYSSFLFLMAFKLRQLSDKPIVTYLMILAIIVGVADILENLQLLKLTSYYINERMQLAPPVIAQLKIWTWIKWGGLAIYMSQIATVIISISRSSWRFLLIILLIPICLLLAAIISNNSAMEDYLATSIFISFLCLTLFCFLFQRKLGDNP
jgi:hypothetical protein